MNETEIKNFILNYDEPFFINDIVALLAPKVKGNINLIIGITEELYNDNFIYYEQVLPVKNNDYGYAFVTDAYYNKNLHRLVLKMMNKYGYKFDENTEKQILSLFDKLNNDKVLNLKRLKY